MLSAFGTFLNIEFYTAAWSLCIKISNW